MPKKATNNTRNRAQRNKPKAQKGFELVLPAKVVPETAESSTTSTVIATQEEAKPSERTLKADGQEQAALLRAEPKPAGTTAKAVADQEAKLETQLQEQQNTPAPKSASARLAARRQAAQKLQQRSAAPLMTSEHFAYVRNDLIKIAVFAMIMITAIIVLYFTFGRA